MNDRETNLRQATAKATSIGILSEMNLELKKNDEGRELIEGHLTIKTSDVNFVRYKASAFRLTKDGKENTIFKGLETIMSKYKPISEVGEEEATRVRVSGEINAYQGLKGNVIGFKSNFFNEFKGNVDEFGSEFEVEVFIKSITPEIDKNGIETGRAIVNGWLPTYSGIEPIALVSSKEDANFIQATYSYGQTVMFYGEIVNNRVEHIKEIPMKFGKPKVEKTYEYKNDMLITGGSEPYSENNDDVTLRPYNQETINLAVRDREARMAQRTSNANTSTTYKPSASAKGRTLGF